MDISINKRLSEYLKGKDFKQKELAEYLVLKDQQVSKWFLNKEQIPDKHIIKIIKYYPDLPARWFITGEGAVNIQEGATIHEPVNGYGKQKDCCEMCREKDERIADLKDHIVTLRQQLIEKKESSSANSSQCTPAAKHGKTG
jgi:transcriptional regulator with XRE-family HTH domain